MEKKIIPLEVEHVELVSSFYKDHRKDVYRFVYNIVRNRELAEDLTQETFIKALFAVSRGQYVDQGNPLTWLRAITRNLAMDYFKQTGRFSSLKPLSDEMDDPVSLVPDGSLNWDEIKLNLEIGEEVAGLIKFLPKEQQDIILFRLWLGMPFKEIAENEEASINTMTGRMRYALINLRRIIKEKNLDLSGYKYKESG